jgi:hypothetical protein
MKKKLFYLLLGAILIGGGLKGEAQMSEQVNATIPFQFHAGGKQLPAGKYTIRSISTADGSLMQIESVDGHCSALFETEQSDINSTDKSNELVFHQVGGDYILSEIVDGDKGIGAEISDPTYSKKNDGTTESANGQRRIVAFFHMF